MLHIAALFSLEMMMMMTMGMVMWWWRWWWWWWWWWWWLCCWGWWFGQLVIRVQALADCIVYAIWWCIFVFWNVISREMKQWSMMLISWYICVGRTVEPCETSWLFWVKNIQVSNHFRTHRGTCYIFYHFLISRIFQGYFFRHCFFLFSNFAGFCHRPMLPSIFSF